MTTANLPKASVSELDDDGLPMRFGDFPITETTSFPPPGAPACWVYLTLNAEIALSLPRSPALQQLIRLPRTRISIDGQWLWWALRRKYPARPLAKLAGSDLIHELAAHCGASGERLLLLGSSPRANAGAVDTLRRRWPTLDVSGFAPPAFALGSAAEAAAFAASRAVVEARQPAYVVLGLGAAKEQRWALRLAPGLDGRVRGVFCFGGAIDMASGQVRRAPALWQRCGIEGLYRVLQQPRRVGRLLRVMRILPRLAFGPY